MAAVWKLEHRVLRQGLTGSQRSIHFRIQIKDAAGVTGERGAKRGEGDLSPAAGQERAAGLGLQLRYALAYRRLAQAELQGGPGEAPAVGYGDKSL